MTILNLIKDIWSHYLLKLDRLFLRLCLVGVVLWPTVYLNQMSKKPKLRYVTIFTISLQNLPLFESRMSGVKFQYVQYTLYVQPWKSFVDTQKYHYSFAHHSCIIHSSVQCWLCRLFNIESSLRITAARLTKRDNRVSVIRRLHWNGVGNLKIAVFARIWSCKACIFIYVRACPQLTIFARLYKLN